MPRPTAATATDTPARILDVAERLVQRRGFNGFSYADVAKELKITTASLHYHFAGKGALGQALIDRYAERFMQALDVIDTKHPDPIAKLHAYADLYAGVLNGKRMCLCGMLAAEYQTLPKPMRDAVLRFFDDNEVWLAKVANEGRAAGTLSFTGEPLGAARMLLSGLEGAMLVARPYDDVARFRSAAGNLIGIMQPREPVAV
jgi:TetR/AcrR family transcriptional regulator, transcriptional repressor for nem operon